MALRDVAIVGAYATEQAIRLPRTSIDLALDAVHGALADAGLTLADVDGLAIDWPGPGGLPNEAGSWSRVLGVTPAWTSDGMADCSGARAVAKAAAAIATGLCDVAVVGGGPHGDFEVGATQAVGSQFGLEFSDCWGAFVATQFALIAQRHMHEYGTTSEQIATMAATIRNHGSVNPEAVMYGRGPYTVDDILASRMIASPLHLLDICIVARGGAAVVLASAERARDLRQHPVLVAGAGMEMHQIPYYNPPLLREVGMIGAKAAARAFALAGVTAHDVDVFTLYDPNAFEVLRQFEVLGLCGEGEGGPFVDDHTFGVDGDYPTNLDGGSLSYAWNGTQQMTLKVVECVKQLRRTAAGRQVADAEVAVAGNVGAGAQHYELLVLERG